MTRKTEHADWAQVIGTYDLKAARGEIRSMLPTKRTSGWHKGGEDRVRLKGLDAAGTVLFDIAVNPLTPSCGAIGDQRLFQELVPVTPALHSVRLVIDGQETHVHFAGSAEPKGRVSLGAPRAGREHRIPIAGDAPAEPSVSYIVQARPEGDTRWHTMAAGLAELTAVDIDINQFPGAAALDVRVLRTNGLETTEVFQERREFGRP
jgi:hypothetical protein